MQDSEAWNNNHPIFVTRILDARCLHLLAYGPTIEHHLQIIRVPMQARCKAPDQTVATGDRADDVIQDEELLAGCPTEHSP